MPTFVAGFLEPPDAGELLSKFSIDTNLFSFYAGEEHVTGTWRTPFVFVGIAVLPALRRLTTAATRTALVA